MSKVQEHTMDNATRNAGDLVEKLTLIIIKQTGFYNERINRNYIGGRKFVVMSKGKITQIIGAVGRKF